MLQQTQIATVTPFYQRFLEAFPTVSHLAQAPLERVLELWSGLGYYRRARHLHQAAQALAQQFGGKFPEDYAGLRTLPGIGDYTAKAVLSIAFNQPYAVLDGNVARVVARLCCLRGNLHQPQFRSAVEAELAGLLSRREPGNFNQALMELGQTICLPRGPRCSACPLAKWCGGYRSGNPEAFPLPRPRRAAESHHLAVALLRRGTRVAMMRGLADGLLDDLWNFPAAFGASPAEALEALREKLAGLVRAPVAALWVHAMACPYSPWENPWRNSATESPFAPSKDGFIPSKPPAPFAMPPCTGSSSNNCRKPPFPNWPARSCKRLPEKNWDQRGAEQRRCQVSGVRCQQNSNLRFLTTIPGRAGLHRLRKNSSELSILDPRRGSI